MKEPRWPYLGNAIIGKKINDSRKTGNIIVLTKCSQHFCVCARMCMRLHAWLCALFVHVTQPVQVTFKGNK